MNFEEFIRKDDQGANTAASSETSLPEVASDDFNAEEVEQSAELDVQKAVVESLAADKAAQEEEIVKLRKSNYTLQSEIATLKARIEEMSNALAKVGDTLAKNVEKPCSNQITLLERNPELEDRFPSETYDQVIEVIREARDTAEKDGRNRRAQILESVLVANQSTGELEKRRKGLEKFFNDNANILSGQVIDKLDKCGISYKNGEEYLLTSEILKRTY